MFSDTEIVAELLAFLSRHARNLAIPRAMSWPAGPATTRSRATLFPNVIPDLNLFPARDLAPVDRARGDPDPSQGSGRSCRTRCMGRASVGRRGRRSRGSDNTGPARRHRSSPPAKRRFEHEQTNSAASPMQLLQAIFSWENSSIILARHGVGRGGELTSVSD